ncbi:hypothetical protein BDQ17DRAFT_1435123 [Cyathus striatus]|nr:hypothetical protein BDQ17DRAFT_1435123 [Cyathus striatus]
MVTVRTCALFYLRMIVPWIPSSGEQVDFYPEKTKGRGVCLRLGIPLRSRLAMMLQTPTRLSISIPGSNQQSTAPYIPVWNEYALYSLERKITIYTVRASAGMQDG